MATQRRRGPGEGSIYQRADGQWVGAVDLGWKDGKRKRKVIYGKTRREVAGRMTVLLQQAETGQLRTGPVPTVKVWLAE
jgi:integrase